MISEAIANKQFVHEAALTGRFLDTPNEETFAELFKTFTPQLVAFFRVRGCASIAEDLTQEVKLTVYRKAEQIRDRSLFRAWMFKIARNTISRHFGKHAREVDTVARSPQTAIHRGVGVSRDRRRPEHPDRNGAVESVQREEEAGPLLEESRENRADGK